MSNSSPALSALLILAHYHGTAANPADILHRFSANGRDLNQTEWLLAAKQLELKARVVRQPLKRIAMLALPALIWREDGQHFILAKIDGKQYLIQDLQQGKPVVWDETTFTKQYSGKVILVASRASVLGVEISRVIYKVKG